MEKTSEVLIDKINKLTEEEVASLEILSAI